jgi:hypothetical protein
MKPGLATGFVREYGIIDLVTWAVAGIRPEQMNRSLGPSCATWRRASKPEPR